jgi:hypothetical protein
MKARRILYIVLCLVVALVVLIVVLIHLFGNSALKAGIETAASKGLNVGVSLEDVDLSILGGKVGLQKLVIDNPPGYEHEKLLELSDARIAVDIGSLLSDTVNIKEIKLDGANVVVEQKGLSNNLQDLIKGIPKPETKEEKKPEGKKLHIDNLEITNTKVMVKLLPVGGKASTVPVPLSTIKMTDLGGDNKLNTAALVSKVLLAIAGGIAKEGADLLPTEMINSLASEMKRLEAVTGVLLDEGGKILEEGKEVIETGKEAIEKSKDIGKDITEGIKGILKPKKEEE